MNLDRLKSIHKSNIEINKGPQRMIIAAFSRRSVTSRSIAFIYKCIGQWNDFFTYYIIIIILFYNKSPEHG